MSLLQAFRRERLSYVVLLCACLFLQGVIPSFAATLFGQPRDALNFILCNGTTPLEDVSDSVGGAHPCLSGQCAMAGCDAGAPQAGDTWKIDQAGAASRVGCDDRFIVLHDMLRVAIRGPPHKP